MDWLNAKDAILGFLATTSLIYAAKQIKNMAGSVELLNIKISEILLHLQYHKQELSDHKERIKRLEDKI